MNCLSLAQLSRARARAVLFFQCVLNQNEEVKTVLGEKTLLLLLPLLIALHLLTFFSLVHGVCSHRQTRHPPQTATLLRVSHHYYYKTQISPHHTNLDFFFFFKIKTSEDKSKLCIYSFLSDLYDCLTTLSLLFYYVTSTKIMIEFCSYCDLLLFCSDLL